MSNQSEKERRLEAKVAELERRLERLANRVALIEDAIF